MEFGLKWVHMARYELILKLDGALWLPIIFKPLLTPKGAIHIQKKQKVRAKQAKIGFISSHVFLSPKHDFVFAALPCMTAEPTIC